MRVEIRKMEPQDEGFIYATWLKSYKNSSNFAKRIKNDVYYPKHHAIVSHILVKPSTHVLIAHTHKDPDHILGFLAYEDTDQGFVAHYMFIKAEFQRIGIGRKLFEMSGMAPDDLVFTHFTYAMDDFMNKHGGAIYDPYRI